MKSKRNISIMLNIMLIVFEIIGLIVYFIDTKKFQFEYYTLDSNLLALIASIFYLFNSNKKITSILKYTSVLSLTITFLVVVFILSPMYNFDYIFMMTKGSMLCFHTICPLVAFSSFIFYENHKIDCLKDSIRALYFTFIYTIVIITLNIFNIVNGPYPFLMVRKNSIITSIIWLIIIEGGACILSYLIMLFKRRIGDENE